MLRTASHLWLLCLLAATMVAAQSPRAGALSAQGVEALKAGKLDEAESFFEQSLRQGGASALVHHNLGVIRQQRGAHAEAVAQFRQAARLQPGNGQSHLLLGVSLLALGKNAEAVSALERAVKLLPKEEQARRQLARAYERAGDWLGAVEQYQSLTELKPQEPEHLYQLGRAYARLSEWSFERIIALDADAARLHQALGGQYLAQGKHDLALAEYRRAALVDPRLPEIHLAMALIHLEQQNFDEARREVTLELALVPESRMALELKQKIDRR
jgi:tetratricopeptide (TPR) repeat protein